MGASNVLMLQWADGLGRQGKRCVKQATRQLLLLLLRIGEQARGIYNEAGKQTEGVGIREDRLGCGRCEYKTPPVARRNELGRTRREDPKATQRTRCCCGRHWSQWRLSSLRSTIRVGLDEHLSAQWKELVPERC